MTDRELLELAARAINGGAWHPLTHDTPNGIWNPLTDDGDALRLAVKLGLLNDSLLNTKISMDVIRNGGDWLSATRRAIVRAAAEIGKGM